MSPEYATDDKFSLKSDIFGNVFGVLLLEIVSGKKNGGFRHRDNHLNLLVHVSRNSGILLFILLILSSMENKQSYLVQ